MRGMSPGWRLTGLEGAVALTLAAGVPAAVAAGSSGWRIVSTTGSPSSRVGTGDIAVTGPSDAWTTWTCGPCPAGDKPHANLMQHWNGQRWSQVELPGQLRYPAVIAGLSVSSARNLWAFAEGGRAVVFNGSGWSVKQLPSWVERPVSGDDVAMGSAVFSPANVWAFSLQAASDPALAGHYTGGSWHKVSLPIVPTAVQGLTPDDIWLYGSGINNGPRTLAHWDGASWKTVSFPHAAGGATLIPFGLTARGGSAPEYGAIMGYSWPFGSYHLKYPARRPPGQCHQGSVAKAVSLRRRMEGHVAMVGRGLDGTRARRCQR